MSSRATYRRRLRDVAADFNQTDDLDAVLARITAKAHAPNKRVPRGRRRKDAPRVCPRCREEKVPWLFPPDERADRDEVMRDPGWCVSCLQEAREVERVRRLDQKDLGAWAGGRVAGAGQILEPWTSRAACAHCGVRVPQSSAYVWSCRRGWGAGVCEGLGRAHVHGVCRWCGYEGIYDTVRGDGRRRIA